MLAEWTQGCELRFARLGYVVMEERYAPAPRCRDYQDGGPIMKNAPGLPDGRGN
jgi:hypothetical protein